MAGFLSNLREKIGGALPWNKPRGSVKFPASTTGFDARELTHGPLEQDVKHRWNLPPLSERRPAALERQYHDSIDQMVERQPLVHTEKLLKHITKEGAWGFGENGSSFFSDRMVNDPRLIGAVQRALKSPQVVSLVQEYGKRGLIRNREPKNAAEVLFENQITAGNHLYDALINDRYHGAQIRSLIRQAKRMDSEVARSETPALAPDAQEPNPEEVPMPQQPMPDEPVLTLSQARSLLEAAKSGPVSFNLDQRKIKGVKGDVNVGSHNTQGDRMEGRSVIKGNKNRVTPESRDVEESPLIKEKHLQLLNNYFSHHRVDNALHAQFLVRTALNSGSYSQFRKVSDQYASQKGRQGNSELSQAFFDLMRKKRVLKAYQQSPNVTVAAILNNVKLKGG